MFTVAMNSVFIGLVLLMSSSSVFTKTTAKRGIPDFGFSSFASGFAAGPQEISYGFQPQSVPFIIKTPTAQSYSHGISPAEIASAVAAAKEASSRVQYAQQRVQQAKQEVLMQEQIARAKEDAANRALQRTEAAAAVQRQAANSAASAVVFAQKKLAEAKSDVAEQQQMAAVKEAIAAAALQKSAKAAAAEIQRSEKNAAKLAAIHRSESQAANQHSSAQKDATLSAAANAIQANNNYNLEAQQPQFNHFQFEVAKFHPWN